MIILVFWSIIGSHARIREISVQKEEKGKKMATEKVHEIQQKLKEVKYPGFSRDIVSFGYVKKVAECDGVVKIELMAKGVKDDIKEQIAQDIHSKIKDLGGIKDITVSFLEPESVQQKPAAHNNQDPWADQEPIPGVKNIIAVASGKGGVGKSTVAVNLACSLQKLGYKTGLLDCDIYGPSIPTMMGTREMPQLIENDILLPVKQYGLSVMSIGFMIKEDEPVIWRGPMIQSAVKQFLKGVQWGDLDFLIVDLPPGTGDAQLSLSQIVPLTGSVIVTTPQDVALIDVKKGVGMFQKVNVPVLGVVENMSYFICPHCNQRTDIFSTGGGKNEAEKQAIPFLGEIPLDPEIRADGDAGKPIVEANPDSPQTKAFINIAQKMAASSLIKQ
jgi:ATP-binding protein involved in chromosome partitioning